MAMSEARIGPRLSIDGIVNTLDITVLSVPGAAILTIFSFYRARLTTGSPSTLLEHLKAHSKVAGLLVLVSARVVNQALTRLARNHGWGADPPRWSRKAGEGDVVLITGGSTGIGKEVVELLAKKTNKIAVLDMAPPTYNAKVVKYYKVDVTDPAAIAEVAKQVRAELGHPTIIINNAGIARGNTILDTTPEQFLLTFKGNVLGCHNTLREFLPHIIAINHGHIMTMSSSGGYLSVPQLGDYAASKAGVMALHEVVTEELVHRYNAHNVRTSLICPLKVQSTMGALLNDAPIQFLMPTLTTRAIAVGMCSIIERGLSDHWIPPFFAASVVPSIRSMPVWLAWAIKKSGGASDFVTPESVGRAKEEYTIPGLLDSAAGL